MKKIIALVTASFLGLALSGCNSVNTGTTVTPSTTNVTVSDLQHAVVAACGFLPTVTTIATIISADPAVATGSQIANLICKAVTTKAVHKGGYSPKYVVVNSKVVLVNGDFVK